MTLRHCLAVLLLASAVLAPAPAATAAPSLADLIERRVDGNGVLAHLRAWERAADRNGGHRATGSPGLAESARYLVDRLTTAGYRVVRRPVPFEDFAFDAESARLSGGAGQVPGPLGAGREVRLLMGRWSPSLPEGGIDARLAVPNAGGDGCADGDYAGQDLTGAVVMVDLTRCALTRLAEVAAGLGARAMLTYLPSPRPGNIWRLGVLPPYQIGLPVATITQAEAGALAPAAANGDVRLHLDLRGHEVTGTTEVILAETAGGDPEKVVMAGAHLDSVTEGPGINDNGTSAAALLETALQLAPYQHRVRDKVRFAWWGAEELYALDSAYYVVHLSQTERAAIAAYLNFELIASPNSGRFVMDGDDSDHPGEGAGPAPEGSAALEAAFSGYFRHRGLPFLTNDVEDVRSDHEPFMKAGIPVGGIYSGGGLDVKTEEVARVFGGQAGDFYDPCYHQPCDRIANLDTAALHVNAKAIAWVLTRLAEGISP
ncbi:M28 family metallopeptidase [Nonomuraea antimicrobica]|uniref:M28 family metallopeptidase n=1 Tax=Nonomuraea antimicrobica TaxID=561173 RepID=A0ABP7DX02_9ACTN